MMINESLDSKIYDVAVIGGGIVGMATAMTLAQRQHLSIVVLEAEGRLAEHQTGHNSGVIHSGLYYKPGSLKALNCVEGRQAMYAFCERYNIPHERCGKVVVATRPEELPQLEKLVERGGANGLEGLRRLSAGEIREFEPHAAGIAGLFVPHTGIVDYLAVTYKYGEILREHGGEIYTGARVTGFEKMPAEFVLKTRLGEVSCRNLINCAGLQSDRIARMCGVDPGVQIVPFRGEYFQLVYQKERLICNLLYPVPDPEFPFLGVHFTRMIHGGVEAGPNAVIAFKREGYRLMDISIRDLWQYGTYLGLWRMASKYWRTGVPEFYRSLNKAAFVKALQGLIPELTNDDVFRSGSGVRAQALDPTGKLVDDFHIVEAEHMVHVLNAPSPAATASLSIGKSIAAMAAKNFDLSN